MIGELRLPCLSNFFYWRRFHSNSTFGLSFLNFRDNKFRYSRQIKWQTRRHRYIIRTHLRLERALHGKISFERLTKIFFHFRQHVNRGWTFGRSFIICNYRWLKTCILKHFFWKRRNLPRLLNLLQLPKQIKVIICRLLRFPQLFQKSISKLFLYQLLQLTDSSVSFLLRFLFFVRFDCFFNEFFKLNADWVFRYLFWRQNFFFFNFYAFW